jgi:hypothetical protein
MRDRPLSLVAAALVGFAAAIFLIRRCDRQGPEAHDVAGGDARAPTAAAADGGASDAAGSSRVAEIGPAKDGGARAADAAACGAYTYEAGMKRGREHASARRWSDAARAFDEAVRARPYDARARAERAYAELWLANHETAIEVTLQLDLARALTRDKPLLAEIHYNLGLAYEKAKDAEGARIAFVRAERLGAPGAARKLAGASRCTVTAEAKGADLALKGRWADVLRELGGACPPPAAATEDDARAFACGGCGEGRAWKKATCSGAGPWMMDTGSKHCTANGGFVQELGGGKLYVETGPVTVLARTPFEPTGKLFVRRTPSKFWTWIAGWFPGRDVSYRQGEGWTDEVGPSGDERCVRDERTEVELVASTGCHTSKGAGMTEGEIRAVYDAAGHFLAAVRLREGDDARVTVRVEEARLVVEGAGCALALPFARAPGP